MAQGFLWDELVVDLDAAFEGIGQVLGGVEARGAQHVGNAAVEAFNHAVGLWGSRFDQTVLDVVRRTDLVKRVTAGWVAFPGGAEAVGKLLTVVGPLSVRGLLILNGALLIRRLRKRLAEAADLSGSTST